MARPNLERGVTVVRDFWVPDACGATPGDALFFLNPQLWLFAEAAGEIVVALSRETHHRVDGEAKRPLVGFVVYNASRTPKTARMWTPDDLPPPSRARRKQPAATLP